MRGATVGANQDAWADDMAQVNRMGAEGAERRQVIVLASIARSLAVIADHLTEGKHS
jgi:phosphate uptake regulator